MAYQQYYGGAIWTHHAIDRMRNRGLSQDKAAQAFNHPDQSIKGKARGSVEYQKRFNTSLVTVIAKQNEKREWIILSCWIDPPLPGSIDAKEKERYWKYQKTGFWGKIWMVFKRQLGF